MDEEFYIVLPSNSSSEYFPNNTTSNFKTHLPRPLSLPGRWSVSLTDMQVPQTFLHVGKEVERSFVELHSTVEERDPQALEKVVDIKHWQERSLVTPGIYNNLEDLVSAVNTTRCLEGHLKFTYLPESGGYVQVKRICGDVCALHDFKLSRELSLMLGFTTPLIALLKTGRTAMGDQPACLASGLPNLLFVYADICEPYITGDAHTPLLNVVSVDVSNYMYGKIETKTFTSPKYIPLLHTNFEVVEIDIRDALGRQAPFEFGTCTVTLHFKKIW